MMERGRGLRVFPFLDGMANATSLVRACRDRGILAGSGRDMLPEQIPEFLKFFGIEALSLRVEDDLASLRQEWDAAVT